MSLSQPPNQTITWFVIFHIASSATLLQLLQRDLLHIEAWHTTVRTQLKRTSCGSKAAKKGISCYDASADSCIWKVRGTCCRGKEDCRNTCVHGLQDFLYFSKTFPQWPLSSWAFTAHEYLPGSRFLLWTNNLLHVSHLKGLSSDK